MGLGRGFYCRHNGSCHCANNGENHVFGFLAVCFRLMRLFSNCCAIVRDCSHCSEVQDLSSGGYRRMASGQP